jgi:prepilin-type N-terminal cleavage/methylation domain-containing protein
VEWGLHKGAGVHARGFTLVETTVALSLAAIVLTALAQLYVLAEHVDGEARRATFASILAADKMEQLKSLGPDLSRQGSPFLDTNVSGACDFLDEHGRVLGAAEAPPGTVYVRRWSVEPLPSDADTFVLQVAVFPRRWRGPADAPTGDARSAGGASLVTVQRRARA